MIEEFIGKFKPPAKINSPAQWFIFQQDQLLLSSENTHSLPLGYELNEFGLTATRTHYLGTYQGQHCFAAEATDSPPQAANYLFMPLRDGYQYLSENQFALASRAKQILSWDKYNQFCHYCASKLSVKDDERAKICQKCQLVNYPQLTPAIIVLVHQQEHILLGRAAHFNANMYSTLAGFIEPGETAEQALEREVHEEAGIRVKNIRYFGTQSWPFPNSFMLGFFAEYHSGEIKIDTNELEDVKWFHIDALPNLPSKASIARSLIDQYVQEQQRLKNKN